MRSYVFLGLTAVAWGLGVACGGASDSGLFGGSGANGAADSGAVGDAGGGNAVDASGGGGQHDAGGGDKDSGGGQVDAAPAKDSGTTSGSIVHCGNSDCPVPSEACCRRELQSNFTYMCLPTGTCQGLNTPSLEIPCDSTDDCAAAGHPGQVCCVTIGDGSGSNVASEVVCRDPSQCTSALSRTEVCDKSDPNACPPGLTCRASSQTLPSYNLCF